MQRILLIMSNKLHIIKAVDERSRITAAEKRLNQAIKYLVKNEVDINSATDGHYRQAILIASGIKLKTR